MDYDTEAYNSEELEEDESGDYCKVTYWEGVL